MEYTIEKKTLRLWQLRISFVAFLAAALFSLFSWYTLYMLIPAAVCLCIWAAAVFWYVPAFFSGYSVFVGENAVVVRRGVIIRTSHIMPYKRLVFAGSYQTPLGRLMGLKGVVLRAARANLIIAEMESGAAGHLIFGVCGEKQGD